MNALPPPLENGRSQGGMHWHRERFPCITASRFADVMGKPKAKSATWTQSALTYAYDLAGARLLLHAGLKGKRFDEHIRKQGSQATDWGHNYEDEARADYEMTKLVTTAKAPFLRIGSIGGSPDGYTQDGDEVGIHEIKCPFTRANHVSYLLNGIPSKYVPQVQGNMWVSGSQWCDFISYYPEMPRKARLMVQRVNRDEEYIKALVERLGQFDKFIDSIVEAYL